MPARKAVTKKAVAKKTVPRKAPAKKAAPRKRAFTNPEWSTACPDWEKRIVDGDTLTPCPVLFKSAAKAGMDVFNDLRIVEAGKDVRFGSSRPWVKQFAEAVFGSFCDEKGSPHESRRMIKTFFMFVSKKNGKSIISAGIMLTELILNTRDEAEFLIIAPTKEAADNCFKPIKAAVENEPELNKEDGGILQVQNHVRMVTHLGTKATLKVVAADSGTVVGKKATGVLVDELHEFGKVSKAEDMLVEATGGLMSRPEGFVIYLTTQSSSTPAGVFKKKLNYARKVRDGKVIDPTFYPIIYEFPDSYLDPRKKQYMREENWYITNPNLGLSVDVPTLRSKFSEAGEGGEDSIQGVVSKHLNIQIGLDLSADAWPAAPYWEAAEVRTVESLDSLLAQCEVVTAGIDGGGLEDLLGLTFTGRVTGTSDRYLSWSHAWVHSGLLERRKEIADRLRDFERDGDLTINDDVDEHAAQLAGMVAVVHERQLLAGIGIDPARIAILTRALGEAGVIDAENPDPKFFVKVRQGWSLYSAMLWVELSLVAGRYQVAPQPIVAWNVGNAKVIPRGNAMLVTKEVSGKAKIDLVMSALNAGELMSYNPPARTGGYSLDALTMMG